MTDFKETRDGDIVIRREKNGLERWFIEKDNKLLLHRENEPAIYSDKIKAYYRFNKRHREGGPAFVNDEVKEWYVNGERHREDGPAIEFADGFKAWFLDGQEYSETDYVTEMRKRKLEATV